MIIESFGPLVLAFDPSHERGEDLRLVNPPKLLIRWFNDETQMFVEDQVGFGAAEAIAPALYLHAVARLRELRKLHAEAD